MKKTNKSVFATTVNPNKFFMRCFFQADSVSVVVHMKVLGQILSMLPLMKRY